MNRIRPFFFRNILFVLLIIIPDKIFTQDIKLVKKTISDLCSKEFAGRGYSAGGDSLTAIYISDFLKKNKLKEFSDGYFQPFRLSVNTFPDKVQVTLNDSLLVPGYDYLVSPESGPISGIFPVIVMDNKLIDYPEKYKKLTPEMIKKSFLLIDTLSVKNKGFKDAVHDIIHSNLLEAKGIIEIEDKDLLHRLSPEVFPFPKIIISRNSLPDKIKTIKLTIKNSFKKNYTTQNIAAYLEGKTDTFIVISAHYDCLGEMGKDTWFPGANDNASGVAMAMELAKYYAKNKKKLRYSIAFLFFGAGEMDFKGSTYYVKNPLFPLSDIKFLINLDMVGTGENGITVVNGTTYRDEFEKLVQINHSNKYIPDIIISGPAANSDHFPFYQKGIKSFYIYTNGEYNDSRTVFDKPNSLTLAGFQNLFSLLTDFIESLNGID